MSHAVSLRCLLDTAHREIGRKTATPRLDCEILLTHALGIDRKTIILNPERTVTNERAKYVLSLVHKRRDLVPVPYLTGRAHFYEHTFTVDSRVLTPRPETEHLVETALQLLRDRSDIPRVLDICTGSGCIGISIGAAFDSELTLADISGDALAVAEQNVEQIMPSATVKTIRSDLFKNIDGRFHMITANPPYLSAEDMRNTENTPLVHEPREALHDGSDNGMKTAFNIISKAGEYLTDDGYLLMELGYNGADMLRDASLPLQLVSWVWDLAGIQRTAVFQRS